jgi:hypothetical protein
MDEHFQDRVGLDWHCFQCVKLLQGEYSQLHEKAEGVANNLLWHVWIVCDCLDFLALLDLGISGASVASNRLQNNALL